MSMRCFVFVRQSVYNFIVCIHNTFIDECVDNCGNKTAKTTGHSSSKSRMKLVHWMNNEISLTAVTNWIGGSYSNIGIFCKWRRIIEQLQLHWKEHCAQYVELLSEKLQSIRRSKLSKISKECSFHLNGVNYR